MKNFDLTSDKPTQKKSLIPHNIRKYNILKAIKYRDSRKSANLYGGKQIYLLHWGDICGLVVLWKTSKAFVSC